MTLVLAIGGPLLWWRGTSRPVSTLAVRPMLKERQLLTMLTHKRKCRKQGDCEEPFSCVWDARVGTSRCLASECETDLQCEPGYTCTLFRPFLEAPSVRLCQIQGTQKEGDRCEYFHLNEERGCRPGLICRASYCGRPCILEEPSTCPDGFVCFHGIDGPSCVPSCLRRPCPLERQCIRIEGEFAVCGIVLGQDCDKIPCPEGEECRREMGYRWRSEVVKMWCSRPCNEKEGRPCPAESLCFLGYCERPCDDRVPGACGPGNRCARYPTENLSICELSE